MKDLRSLEKMVLLEGEIIRLADKERRTVTLEVNTPIEACFIIELPSGASQFLANVIGYETLQFIVAGPAVIHAVNPETGEAMVGEIWFYTPELEYIADDPESNEDGSPVIFTKMANRAARNPEMERMMSMQARNFERRMEKMAGNFARLVENAVKPKPAKKEKESVVVKEEKDKKDESAVE